MLEDIVDFTKNLEEHLDNEEMGNLLITKSFLEIARNDLKASKILYDEELYPQSIYFLQQSVEKATKGFALSSTLLSVEDVYTHNTPEIFLKLQENPIISRLIEIFKKVHPSIKDRTDKIKEIFEEKNDEVKIEIATADEEGLRNFLKILHKSKNILGDHEGTFQGVSSLLNIMGEEEVNSNFVLDSTLSSVKFYLLGVLTYPHESFTRYPDKEITPSDYTEDMGIVKIYPEIYERTKKAIEREIKNLNELEEE